MRIRKHAKTSFLSSSSSLVPCTRADLQTPVCELNRSPWDVIPFVPETHLSQPKEEYQAAGEKSFTRNDSGEESAVSVFYSVDSLRESPDERTETTNSSKGREMKMGFKRDESLCNKTDGKRWQCKKEAKVGHSLCDHHLTQLRSYHYYPCRKSDDTEPRRRNKERVPSSTSDFYYYSGFGPSWGKKRGGEGKRRELDDNARTTPSSPHDDHVHYQCEDDDDGDDNNDDEDGDDDNHHKRRIRKPVKARSLKSLL